MSTPLPQISDRFETASNGLDPEMRARYVIAAFTTGTLGSGFDVNNFDVRLYRHEELGTYIMEFELLPEASQQNRDNFNELKMTFAESIVAIEHSVMEGQHTPFELTIEHYAEEGFVLMTPDLNDYTALYTNISESYNFGWDDPKFCAECGRDYSLADINQAIALIPETDDEDATPEMDRPVDMGLPKPWLQ
jgi:hypothetical protein